MRTSILLGALSLVLVACGSATPAPSNGAAESPVGTQAPLAASATPAKEPAIAEAAPAAPEQPDVLATDSAPPGVTKLSQEEADDAKKACMPLADAMAKAAQRQKLSGAAERNTFIQDFLKNPPKIARMDAERVGRCADLLLRDVRGYLAAMIESEAKMNIGRIVVALSYALESDPPVLCKSAGPVPADLGSLAAGPWSSTTADWSAPGFACAHFTLAGEPQRFQYQLVTNSAAATWEVIARGFPVKGGEPTELYAHGKLEGGHIKPSRDVYRRAVKR